MKKSLYPEKEELRNAYKSIKGVKIPSVPEVVVAIHDEVNKNDADINIIKNLIEQDPVIAGIVLKTVNSPLFGLTANIESIQQAVMIMGTKNIANMVIGSALEKLFKGRDKALQSIWEENNAIAFCASAIASSIVGVSKDEGYLVGLFHNCGALLLAKKYDDYKEVIEYGKLNPVDVLAEENKRYGSNHAVIGFILSHHWKLPQFISLAIYHHHVNSCRQINSSKIRGLIATIKVSSSIVDKVLFRENTFSEDIREYDNNALAELALEDDDITDLADELNEFIFSN
ncbi:MAG: HDOD domain-containing protein [Methylococcales bacterium]|jgi:HD-like signal output (HDOD) protein|nr:HDOD domain-containing protein [Methylococcales bacterium]MBT7409818.1 HDOD domain-containing protein [Methylococcales bacterium]